MSVHAFTVVIVGDEDSEEMAEALCEAGCNDGSLGMYNGEILMDFHREAKNREAAIASAKADIEKAGYQVSEVRDY